MICPICDEPIDGEITWPVKLPDGKIAEGCQNCWEEQST